MSDERVVEADAIRVFVREEGIAIDFGRGREDPQGDGDLIETVSKVVVDPGAFRRLGMALHEVLRRLPKEPVPAPAGSTPTGSFSGAGRGTSPSAGPQISFIGSTNAAGAAATKPATASSGARSSSPPAPSTRPPLEDLLAPTRDMPSSRAPTPAASEHGSRLLSRVSALGAPYVHERSFRMRPGELLPHRFLLSVGRPDDGSASDEALAAVFRDIGMPAPFLEAALPHLPQARCVHFGFEGDGGTPLLKMYLEVAGKVDIASVAEEPTVDDTAVLEHIAYKWNPISPEVRVVGRYLWYPKMTAEEIRARVESVYDGGAPEAREIAFGVIALAAGRMPERDIHYLEIEEDGNPRRSYSINFYDADLKVRDLHPLLSRMRRLFEVSPGRFQVLYDQIKTRRFGHLAGGVHRNGKGFFNVYYGPQFFGSGAPEGPWRGALLRGGPPTASS